MEEQDAFWVLDRSSGALIAKTLIRNNKDKGTLLERPATLQSALFKPAPQPLGSGAARNSCRFSLRALTASHCILEVFLQPHAPASGGARPNSSGAVVEPAPSNYVPSKQPILMQSMSSGQSENKWTNYSVALFVDSTDPIQTYYRLLLTGQCAHKLSAGARAHEFEGVAVANFSLTPQCFEPAAGRAERHQQRADADDGALLQRLVHMSPLSQHWFLLGLLLASGLLVLVSAAVVYLLCLQSAAAAAPPPGAGGSPAGSALKSAGRQLCGCLPLAGQRARVYTARDQHEHHLLRHPWGAARGAGQPREPQLHPLSHLFDDVELAENPGYLSTLAAGCFGGVRDPQRLEKTIELALADSHMDRKRLTLTQRLGKGAFGEVYQGCLVCYSDACNSPASGGARRATSAYCTPSGAGAGADWSDKSRAGSESHSLKVAVKTLTDERTSETDFVREAANMSMVAHRNIVRLIGVCFEERPLYIVMELLEGGNLKNFLIQNRQQSLARQPGAGSLSSLAAPALVGTPSGGDGGEPLCTGDLLVFGLDVARACHYLQEHRFIHRDLAARNCLLSAACKRRPSLAQPRDEWASASPPVESPAAAPPPPPNESRPPSALSLDAQHRVDLGQVFLNGFRDSSLVVKLADFGMARDVYTDNYYRTAHREIPIRWMPPECLDGLASSKSDVWSFGVLLWELFSMGQLPYQNLLDNRQVIEFLKRRRVLPAEAQPQDSAAAAAKGSPPLLLIEPPTDDDDGQPPDGESPAPAHHDLLLSGLPVDEAGAWEPPLPPPHSNTPYPVYSIMCACWASNPDERPRFEEIANRLYWCTQMPEVLAAPLPRFLEHQPPSRAEPQSPRPSGHASGQTTQTTQLNWFAS